MITLLARMINMERGWKTYLFDPLSLIQTSNARVSHENNAKPPIYFVLKNTPQNHDVTMNVTSWSSH